MKQLIITYYERWWNFDIDFTPVEYVWDKRGCFEKLVFRHNKFSAN